MLIRRCVPLVNYFILGLNATAPRLNKSVNHVDDYHGANHLGARGTDTGIEMNSEVRHMFDIIHEIHDKLVAKTPCVESFNISCNEKSIDGTEDLLCMVGNIFLRIPISYSQRISEQMIDKQHLHRGVYINIYILGVFTN